jgi:hypothetical protein
MFIIVFTLLLFAAAAAVGAFNAARPWLAWPGLVILTAVLVRALLTWQALRRPRVDNTQPVRQAVQAAVDRLRFAESYWERAGRVSFYLPFLVGEILAFEGLMPIGVERGVITAGFYAFLLFIVVLGSVRNRREARQTVRPLREDLESWLADLAAFDQNGSSRG